MIGAKAPVRRHHLTLSHYHGPQRNLHLKNLPFVILLSTLAVVGTHHVFAADAKNDPSQYPLAIHVSASAYAPRYDFGRIDESSEIVTATIDGKHYQLLGPTSTPYVGKCCHGLLNPGDYHAKLVKDEHKTAYESLQEFEILFPDGTTRRFQVISQSE
jgi:hypothetical protein